MQRSSNLLVCFCFFLCCIVTFEHADALRRIKRGSIATKGGSMLAKNLGHELHANASRKDDNNNTATIASVEAATEGTNGEHSWSKKDTAPKAAIEKPIDDVDKASPHATSPATRSAHAHLQYTNTADIKPSYVKPLESPVSAHKQAAPLDSSAKELHKNSPFFSWFDPLHSGWFDDAQLERVFNGDGPDVLIIDNNNMQPVAGERAALNFRTPKLHSLKPLADSGKHGDNSEQQRSNHNEHNTGHNNNNDSNNDNNNSHHNNNKGIDTKFNDRGQNNATLSAASNRNTNNNDGDNSSSSSDNNKVNNADDNNNRKRIDDSNAEKDNDSNNHNNNAPGRLDTHAQSANHHSATCAAGGNVISANNNNNNFNPHAANNYGGQRQQLQQQTFSVPPLLALAGSGKVDQRTNDQRLQAAGAPMLQQHEKPEHQQQQQQQQPLQSHFSGKVLPVDSMLKFANMLLYKMDGAPIHAQRAEVSINSNPPSNVENSDDLDTIDFFYNNLEPQVAPVLRFPQPMSIGGGGGTSALLAGGSGALSPHPFLLPPFNMNEAPPPFNLLESALDLFLSGGEDDGEDQIELRCPIHHEPKKKATEAAAGGAGNSSAETGSEGKDEDGKGDMIQVCSCRFFKKKKSA